MYVFGDEMVYKNPGRLQHAVLAFATSSRPSRKPPTQATQTVN